MKIASLQWIPEWDFAKRMGANPVPSDAFLSLASPIEKVKSISAKT